MKKIIKKSIKKLVKNIRKTFLNKVLAIILFGLGWLSMEVSNDATFLVFILLFVIPLFFSKENWIIGKP